MELLLIYNLIILFFAVRFYLKYSSLKKKDLTNFNSLNQITQTINSVRYGNLNARIEPSKEKKYKGFINSINRMIEAIEDREIMIKEQQKEITEQLKQKEDFIATVTHDLKVPIIAEANTLNFLLEERFGELNDKQKEALKNLVSSNKELIEMVEIILETYKIETAIISACKNEVNLNSFIEEAIEDIQPIALANAQTINFSSIVDLFVKIDEFHIKRVIKNLLLNATSYAPKGSNIDIELSSKDKMWRLDVTDYGRGISKADIANVFEKFYSTANKFRKVGTGLGLYLSKKIIESNEGKIYVESVENEKTTFTIELPL